MESAVADLKIRPSEPTALSRVSQDSNVNYLSGLTALIAFSFVTSVFGGNFPFKGRVDCNKVIKKSSFTNFEIENALIQYNTIEFTQDFIIDDYFDYAINPVYSDEFTIRVKSFKIEKTIPLTF